MIDPRQQFDQPEWDILAASNVEGQWYERKVTSDPERIANAISGFANSNPEGGLVVLGIEDGGTIKGLDHLGQLKIAQLQNATTLVTHQVEQKLIAYRNGGAEVTLLLIYTPFSPHRLVETNKGKAFKRVGESTIELRYEERRELEYTKGQIRFEDEPGCVLDIDILQGDVLEEVRQVVLERDGLDGNTSIE